MPARVIYAGGNDGEGSKLVLSGPLVGSALGWQGVFVASGGRAMSPKISTATLKFLAYEKNPPAEYRLGDLRFKGESFEAAGRLHGL